MYMLATRKYINCILSTPTAISTEWIIFIPGWILSSCCNAQINKFWRLSRECNTVTPIMESDKAADVHTLTTVKVTQSTMGWTNESMAVPPSANQSPAHSNLLISQLTIELLIYSELFTARCITFAPGRLLWRKLNCNIPTTFLDKDRSYWDWLSSAWLVLWWSPLNVDICNPLDPAMSPQWGLQ